MDTRSFDPNFPEALQLSDEEVTLRKRWLEFEPGDEEILKDVIDNIMGSNVDQLIEGMYTHFLSFEETKSFFADEKILKRAQESQKQYFIRLTKGNYDIDYVNDRLRVGSMHHQIDLDPKWYLGAYNRVLSWCLPRLIEKLSGQPEALGDAISALMKIVFFDMGLAIECYIAAKETSIRKHRDAISELETERRVTKSMLESAPIGIVSLSDRFVCQECNDEFVQIVKGTSRSELVGKSIFEIAPGLNRKFFEEVLSSGHSFQRESDRLQLPNPGGLEVYWDWAMWPVKDDSGRVSSVVAMFANASDRVTLQQQREDFVATLTHDLKTPISATNRAVRFLLEGDYGAISESQREILDTILQSNTALYSLVQTLLDVYRFDSGVKELIMRKANIAAVITQTVTEIMPLAQDKGVDIKATLPAEAAEVLCDPEEIRRVIQNLVDNSLKFTVAGGSITIVMLQTEEVTTVSVSDTGRGIPEENKPKLFQRFWQAGFTGRYYASTGLGLYLCRRIVEAHRGRIWCESTQGQGSTFFFELPVT